MKKKRIRVSPAEWEIMEAVWDGKKAISVREVLEKLYPNSEKAYTTVQTVMNNLEQKGILKKEKIGLVNFYKAQKRRVDAVRDETQNFVRKVFSGSFHDLANYLIETDKLTRKDIAELKRMIREKEKQAGDGAK